MTAERKIFWSVVALAVLAVGALLLWPRVEERVAPRPVAAWVAIEVEGSGIARAGRVEIPAGTPFTLHALLEAETRDGGRVFYTEAAAVELAGERLPEASLRRWSGPLEAKVLWFTIEGPTPYLELAPGQDLARFRLTEFLRSDWPFAWSVRGRVEPAHDDHLAAAGADAEIDFGTQRYQVRIELFEEAGQVVPQARFASWGKEALPERLADFPTVTALLPGVAAPASAAFGLTQVEWPPAASAAPEVRDTLVRLTRQRLAFSRVPLLAEIFAAAGRGSGELAWRETALAGDLAWGSGVQAGDLLRAGDRLVILYRDAAPPAGGAGDTAPDLPTTAGPGDGRLDGDDLVLDYARGAAVRRLSEVFDLTAGGTVEWAPLRGRG